MAVSLRKISHTDVEFMLKVENDPQVWIYSEHTDAPYSREEIENFCKNEFTDQCRYVIESKNQSVGFIDLYNISDSSAYIAIIIYEKSLRHCKIGSQAIQILETLALTNYCLNIMYAEVPPQNEVSVKFFEANGFKRCSGGNCITLCKHL